MGSVGDFLDFSGFLDLMTGILVDSRYITPDPIRLMTISNYKKSNGSFFTPAYMKKNPIGGGFKYIYICI